ncbi:uncharacterized protein LOC133904821 [Phragmites australis]|uniref:uncharacterized protein LOC133904821 n=1 Tax=Phragmites australis TaxID=29695 RepID=UPI002D76769C|nr:uncharacterized protein LOC133904821 [Phragmites australis]
MMVLVNKIRELGSEELDDHKVVRRSFIAFAPRNPNLVTLSRERRDYKRLTPSDVLGRILAQELMEEEANEIKNLVKQSSTSKNKEVAFKASKSKQVAESSSSEEKSSDDEEIAFFVRKFKKFMKKGGYSKYKRDMFRRRTSMRACYECDKVGHFIVDCPNKKKSKNKYEKKNKTFKKGKYNTRKKYSGQAHIGEEWDSDYDSDSDDEGVVTIVIRSSTPTKSLFGDMSDDDDTPKCLMVKERKVAI